MRTVNRKSMAAMIAVAVMAFVALAATTAQAQILATNNSGCTIFLTLVDAGGATAGPFTVPSGTISTSITLPAGFVPVGVEDINGRTRRFVITPPSPGCTGCVPLGAQGGDGFCCVDVCYDSGAQTITIAACNPCQ